MVLWVRLVLGLPAVRAGRCRLAVLVLRHLQLVLELQLRLLGSGRLVLAVLGRRVCRVLHWVLVVRVVLVVLGQLIHRSCLAVLVLLGFRWVRVGRVVLADRRGTVCMAVERRRRMKRWMVCRVDRVCLVLLGCLVYRAGRVVRLVRVHHRCNKLGIHRPLDGRYGC